MTADADTGAGHAQGAPADGGRAEAVREPATLYVICGSHACRSAMLMLEHKRVPYRRVQLLTGPHGLSVRLRGFLGNPTPIREVDGATHRMLALLDRAGTVPALRYGERRVQRNIDIARFLDAEIPQPPLFPHEPELRAEVERAEQWGDRVLQMAARRIGLVTAVHGLDALHNRGASGRLGPLLADGDRMRALAARGARLTFRANAGDEARLVSEIPPMLDRVDAWIGEGVLDGPEPNAADFMIAPSLALLTYRADLCAEIAARPAGALVDRFVPEPPGA